MELNSLVGSLADNNDDDDITCSFAEGEGDTDNLLFNIEDC